MRGIFLTLLTVTTLLKAEQLDAIIANTLLQHASLKSIEQRMNTLDDAMAKAELFNNPEVILGINDLLLTDPLNRSVEPMQTTTLALKQKIPYFGKRQAMHEVLQARKDVIYHSLEAAEVALVKAIKLTAYAIWEHDADLKIIDDLLKTLEQSMELQAVYSRTNETSHMQMMIAELSLSQLKIKKSKLESTRHALLARLSYLADADIATLDLDLHVTVLTPLQVYEEQLENNRDYHVKKAQLMQAKKEVRIAKLARQSDVTLGVAYHYRAAFDDYVNISMGMTLPIYGRETHDIEASQKKVLEASFVEADWWSQIRAQLQTHYAALQDAYTVEHIITDETLPQIDHMLELADAAIRSGADMTDYLELIERKLALDEQRIGAVVRYYSAQARISALIGEKE